MTPMLTQMISPSRWVTRQCIHSVSDQVAVYSAKKPRPVDISNGICLHKPFNSEKAIIAGEWSHAREATSVHCLGDRDLTMKELIMNVTLISKPLVKR